MPDRKLAAQAAGDGALAQLCTFRVGGEDYAIDIMRLREIITPLPVTPVPRAPSFVEGVIRLRGDVIPILDVRRRLGLPVTPPTRKTRAETTVTSAVGLAGSGGIFRDFSLVLTKADDEVWQMVRQRANDYVKLVGTERSAKEKALFKA